MVGDAVQDGTATDSTAASAGAAQALSGDRVLEKSARLPGNAAVKALAATQSNTSTEGNQATLLTLIAQPAAVSANAPAQAFGTDADSTKTSNQAKTQTVQGTHATGAADLRKETKRGNAFAGTSQLEAAVFAGPTPQATVLPVPLRTGTALDSTPGQFAFASQAEETNGAAGSPSSAVQAKTAATSPAAETHTDPSVATSKISHFGNSPVAQLVADAEVDEGAVDASVTQTGQGVGLPQTQAANKETESLPLPAQPRLTASSPVSTLYSSLYPMETAENLQIDAESSVSGSACVIGKASQAAVARPEMSGSGHEATTETTHVAAAQTVSAANETFNLSGAQNLCEVQAGAANGGSGASSPSSAQAVSAASTSKEPFATMDGVSGGAAPTWIHAGIRQAEAGFQDPSLGWVGIHAQVDGNAIHATVVPGSAEAAQSLAGHLAGLNTYLADHHTPVETLTLDSPENRWGGQGMEQGTGQQAGQGAGQGGPRGQETSYSSVATGSLGGLATDGVDLTTLATPPGGVYISVMA
jgi:hypothetical protein